MALSATPGRAPLIRRIAPSLALVRVRRARRDRKAMAQYGV